MTTTIDTHAEAKLALTVESVHPLTGVTAGTATYVPISEAPPLDRKAAKRVLHVYLKQLHYCAGHKPSGISIQTLLFNGKPAPKTGWEIYK